MLIGYARVSTEDQTLDLQIDALKNAGCSKIFSDKASGVNKDKFGLNNAISHLRPSDTFVIWKLDRLGRNLKGLIELVERLNEDGIQFRSIRVLILRPLLEGSSFTLWPLLPKWNVNY